MRYSKDQNKLSQATMDEKRHYKMYKSGKQWVVAGVALLFAGALAVVKPNDAAAATTDAPDAAATATQTDKTSETADGSETPSGLVITSAKDSGSETSAPAGPTKDVPVKDSETPVTGTEGSGEKQTTDTPAVNANQPATTDGGSTSATGTKGDNAKAASDHDTVPAAPAKQAPAKSQPETVTNLGDADAKQVAAAQGKATADYLATGKPQKVVAVSAGASSNEEASGKELSSDRATVDLSSTKVGYGSGQKQLIVTYNMKNTQVGDTYTITVPANNMVLSLDDNNIERLKPDVATTTIKRNADGTVITNVFTGAPQLATQTITFNLKSNSQSQANDKPHAEVGTLTYPITWQVNQDKVATTPLEVTVTPEVNIAPVTRAIPDASVHAVLPDTTYVYEFAVNETNGVEKGGAASARVNSNVNFGTTITIPVPTGFKLDETLTRKLSGLSDADLSTITQGPDAGSPITIKVPKGSGSETSDYETPYQLVGKFEIAQTSEKQTLTAAAPTMTQQFSDGKTITTHTFTGQKWTETILAKNATPDVSATVHIVGNSSSTPDKLYLDADSSNDPKTLLSATFAYQSPAAGKGVQLKLTIPDGLDATQVSVPTDIVRRLEYQTDTPFRRYQTEFLPGTILYNYQIEYADNTSASGSVAAGGNIGEKGGKAIRSVTFTPNALAAGATTGPVVNTEGSFQVYGTLADKYVDKDDAVKAGDTLKSTFTVSLPEGNITVKGTTNVTQTVVAPKANVSVWANQGSKNPGDDSGTIGLHVEGTRGTDFIYEPVLYYVLPAAVTPQKQDFTELTDGAHVSQFLAPDGRIVVKVDYSGTKRMVNTAKMTTDGTFVSNVIKVQNDLDAMPGSYPLNAYIVSPTTDLYSKIPKNKTNTSILGDGNQEAYVLAISSFEKNWEIIQAKSTSAVALAQGDYLKPRQQDTIDKKSKNQAAFFTNVTTADEGLADVSVVLNLPEKDVNGSGYTFDLNNDGVILPPELTSPTAPMKVSVAYSGVEQDFKSGSTKNNLQGFQDSVDQIDGGWKGVRSIKISIPKMAAKSQTGRIRLNGTIEDMINSGGKTGNVELGFYVGDDPVITNEKLDASLAVTGNSTLKSRGHYVDGAGVDHYIDLTSLVSKTYEDRVDTVESKAFPTVIDKLPEGYTMTAQTPKLVKVAGDVNSQAVQTLAFGVLADNSINGDYVQYELTPTQKPGIPDGGTGSWTINKQPGGVTPTTPQNGGETAGDDGPITDSGLPDTFGGPDTSTDNHQTPDLADTFGKSNGNQRKQHQGLPETGGAKTVALAGASKRTLRGSGSGSGSVAAALPQTGDTHNGGLVALGLASLFGLLGLVGQRRKEN